MAQGIRRSCVFTCEYDEPSSAIILSVHVFGFHVRLEFREPWRFPLLTCLCVRAVPLEGGVVVGDGDGSGTGGEDFGETMSNALSNSLVSSICRT